jgi:5-methylcytosine-specific restriction enzyme subunit McrC
MVCHYDEITHNILHNQIIKTTLYFLLKNNQIERKLKQEIRSIYPFFKEVSTIKLQPKVFNDVRIQKKQSVLWIYYRYLSVTS